MMGGSGSQQQLQYQRRVSAAGGSPPSLEPLSAGGVPMPGPGGVAGGYFQNRNQSLDVGALNSGSKPLKNKI